MSETVLDKALRKFREDMDEVADIRRRLERLMRRNGGDPASARCINSADRCLHYLCHRISEAYSEVKEGAQ